MHYLALVGGWTATAIGAGFALVVLISAVAAGYILGGFILGRIGRTVMGTHVRHFFTRIAPSKRFSTSDRDYVEDILSSLREKGL